MADKLEVLDKIEDGIRSLESSIGEVLPSGLEVDFDRIVSSLSEVVEELQWHKDLSAVSQLIKAIEAVEEAVRMQR